MAQPNHEQYVPSSTSARNGQGVEGEEDFDVGRLGDQLHEPPSSQVGYGGGDHRYSSRLPSSTSAGNGQGVEGEEDFEVGRLGGRLHEPPSSQVGYGGGDHRYPTTPSLQKRSQSEEISNDEDSRHGQLRRGEHEPPSSQVGYGGGDDRFVSTLNSQQQGHWEEGNNEGDSRYAQERREESDTGTRAEQQEGVPPGYGSVDPNANPDEAEFGSSGPGRYSEDGGNTLGGYGDASSKSSGTYARRDLEGSSGGSRSEVRNGVPHRVTSDGVASGVGISNGSGSAISDDVQQQAFHLVDVSPSQQKDTPYSQLFTQPDGPTKGSPDQFYEEEGVFGNTKGGTAVDHHREAVMATDGAEPEKEELLTKLKRKLAGNGQKHEVTDSNSDIQGVDPDAVLQEDEGEKPGFVSTLKNKLRTNHEKHHDEINPEIFE